MNLRDMTQEQIYAMEREELRERERVSAETAPLNVRARAVGYMVIGLPGVRGRVDYLVGERGNTNPFWSTSSLDVVESFLAKLEAARKK